MARQVVLNLENRTWQTVTRCRQGFARNQLFEEDNWRMTVRAETDGKAIFCSSDHQGEEFFRKTREQWESVIHPDYVLIDCRSGHTNVQGICTRQLADAVVAVFFPDRQNLSGLRQVCEEIRADFEERGRPTEVKLHFVMSSVPQEDEYDIIGRREATALDYLHAGQLTATIHHSPTLELLDQPLMVLEQPSSRVAREYEQLARALMPFDAFVQAGSPDHAESPSLLSEANQGAGDPGLTERLPPRWGGSHLMFDALYSRDAVERALRLMDTGDSHIGDIIAELNIALRKAKALKKDLKAMSNEDGAEVYSDRLEDGSGLYGYGVCSDCGCSKKEFAGVTLCPYCNQRSRPLCRLHRRQNEIKGRCPDCDRLSLAAVTKIEKQ